MKTFAILALGGLLLATPTAAQDRWDRDLDQMRGYGQYHQYDPYSRSDRYDRYGQYRSDYDRPNTWGGSYSGDDVVRRYGRDGTVRDVDRSSGVVREYRKGNDYCYYRGDYRRGWSC